MKFINNNEDKKMRSGSQGNYTWTLVKKGETVELPLEVGQAYGFTYVEGEGKPEVTEGKAGTKTVETKQAVYEKDAEKEPPVPEEQPADPNEEVEKEPSE